MRRMTNTLLPLSLHLPGGCPGRRKTSGHQQIFIYNALSGECCRPALSKSHLPDNALLNLFALNNYKIRFGACQPQILHKNSHKYPNPYKNSYLTSVSPHAGAVGPAAHRFFAASISAISSGCLRPLPASMSVPAIIRTIL